ncbi:hypothetical protein [Methylobacterium sp. Leaf117]|uniref:hypothetical protein n=1 Tax=Methylobacterium sp. Leaf117 TaxID=1736260 RepID=UPI000702067A|nr:hypothetical protein [Methylobacterium sp. Leaf117]KQP90787.1 hypothetical protein ASF57_23560 [Methylobacterium sp. Leaf117]
MPVFEVTSRVTRRSLMHRTKDELALRVLELMDLLDQERARRPEGSITLTPEELRNLLKVSWRDGNGLREMFQDEWPETMHANVKQTMAEIDRWKVEGVSKESYPEESRCPCGVPYSECCDEAGITEAECPTYGA